MVDPLVRLEDGTVRQVGPLTGTHVWTIPGRVNRPVAQDAADGRPLPAGDGARPCSFCARRYLETTPEKSRLLRHGVIPTSDHAIALAGVGHRSPSLEVYSTAGVQRLRSTLVRKNAVIDSPYPTTAGRVLTEAGRRADWPHDSRFFGRRRGSPRRSTGVRQEHRGAGLG